MAHVPVLLKQVIDVLDPQPGEVFLDGTVGSGGHAAPLAERLGKKGRLIALDQDESSLAKAKQVLVDTPAQIDFVLANFRNLGEELNKLGLKRVDGILLDLGVHSDQFGPSGRGFSFLHDEPLQMTMKVNPGPEQVTAYDIVNDWQEESLAAILKGFGEEPFAERISEAIIRARRDNDIETTGHLVEIIRSAVPEWYTHKRLHFATRTFQALRMATNDELGALKQGLEEGWKHLAVDGRFAVISFHSLEARMVKNFFRELKKEGHLLLTKHALKPERSEVLINPRARSAELRAIKKITV